MTYYERKKKVVDAAMEAVKEIEGYKVFRNPEHSYFYVVTPRDNVLCIQHGDFFGLTATFEYKPNKKTGIGCACSDDPFYEISKEKLVELETEGRLFAQSLHAKFYRTADEFFDNNWDKENIVRVA